MQSQSAEYIKNLNKFQKLTFRDLAKHGITA